MSGNPAGDAEGFVGVPYGTVRKYFLLFKLLLCGDSVSEISRRTRWSEYTVGRVIQWTREAEPEIFHPAVESPVVVDDSGESVGATPDTDTPGQVGHIEILLRLALLFENSVVIPRATLICGIDSNKWPRGYFGRLDQKPRLRIEYHPLFKVFVVKYERAGFETAVDRLKSDLLKYSIHAQELAGAIADQLEIVEQDKTEALKFRQVPEGMALAVMHWSIERVTGDVSEFPPMPVIGDEEAGIVLEFGGWRAKYDKKSEAQSDADRFGSAVDQASDLDEIGQVEESRAQCERALAAVIRTLRPDEREKI